MKTVAIVAPHYPPMIGGVEQYAARIADALAAEAGFTPVVLTSGAAGFRTRETVQDGVRVVRLGTWLRLSNSPLSPLWPFQVRSWLRKVGADLVHAHAPVPGLGDIAIAVSGKRPTVFTYHSGSMRKGRPDTRLADLLIGCYERFVLPRVFNRTDVPVAVSPTSLAAGRPAAIQITPGVDPDRFVPGLPASRRARDILYVGRIERASAWKGVDVLIHAMALTADLPEARLRLVGTGDATTDLLKLAADLGVADRVESVGALHGADLVEALRSAAVLALPSLTESEGFGMVLIEAMACATPVVASAVGGPRFILEGSEAGLLVPPGDSAALAAACRHLLTDGESADRMGAAGRRAVEQRFAWPEQTRRYVELFRKLLDDASD
jgi:glycosyltransferase involved in cell wall biosynthesis